MHRYQLIVTRAAALCAMAAAVAGCPQDPNKNSMTVPDATAPSGSGAAGVGNPGTGGTLGGAMGPIMGSPVATFDSTIEGFALDVYHDPVQTNLNDPSFVAPMRPAISWDSAEGNPDVGSLMVVAPYSGASQYVDIQKNVSTLPQNWMGKTLHVRIRATTGTFRGGVQIYVKTGMAYVFGGTYINFAASSNWQEFTLNVTAPMTIIPMYDPSRVFSFGVQLNSGSAGAAATPVTFNIDSFSIDPPIPATGQADAGSDTAMGDDAASSDAAPAIPDTGTGTDAAVDLGAASDVAAATD